MPQLTRSLFALASVVILAGAQLAQARQPDDLEAMVTAHIEPLIEAQVLPGAVVGVLRDGEERFFGFGGTAADGSGPLPDADTLYEIGSITKVFTAVLLAEMALRGEVSLETPIADVYPEAHEAPQRGEDPIRLWHLACHASGLTGMPLNLRPENPDDPFEGYTTELMYSYLDDVGPARAPEVAYEYSNLASGLLGRLLQEQAGTP